MWHKPIFKGVLPIKNNLSKKIRDLRLKSGLTQAQLANKLRISPSAVGMYEQGRREPDSHTLSKICRVLDASGDYVLDLAKDANNDLEKSEIYNVICNFIENLEHQDNLMLNGIPISSDEKKKIASALKVATAVTLSDMDEKL